MRRPARWSLIPRPPGGFALPVVLLIVTAMSLLALRLSEGVRVSATEATARADEFAARQAADGGIAAFLAHAAAGADLAVGRAIELRVGAAAVTVRWSGEGGRVDLNTGPLALLRGLFHAAGADQRRAARLAAQIEASRAARPPITFRAVAELMRFDGMDAALFARVAPDLTVFGATPGIDPLHASRRVLGAVPGMTPDLADAVLAWREGRARYPAEAQAVLAPYAVRGRPVYRVQSLARLGERARFEREAVVDLAVPAEAAILVWRRRFDVVIGTAEAALGAQGD